MGGVCFDEICIKPIDSQYPNAHSQAGKISELQEEQDPSGGLALDMMRAFLDKAEPLIQLAAAVAPEDPVLNDKLALLGRVLVAFPACMSGQEQAAAAAGRKAATTAPTAAGDVVAVDGRGDEAECKEGAAADEEGVAGGSVMETTTAVVRSRWDGTRWGLIWNRLSYLLKTHTTSHKPPAIKPEEVVRQIAMASLDLTKQGLPFDSEQNQGAVSATTAKQEEVCACVSLIACLVERGLHDQLDLHVRMSFITLPQTRGRS